MVTLTIDTVYHIERDRQHIEKARLTLESYLARSAGVIDRPGKVSVDPKLTLRQRDSAKAA
jgi:hypothetical protein